MGRVKAKDLQRKPPGHQQAECGFLRVVHGVLAHTDTAMRDQEVRSQSSNCSTMSAATQHVNKHGDVVGVIADRV